MTSDGTYSDVDDWETPCQNCTECKWDCGNQDVLGIYTFAYCTELSYVQTSCFAGSDTVCSSVETTASDILSGEVSFTDPNTTLSYACVNGTLDSDIVRGKKLSLITILSEEDDIPEELTLDIGNIALEYTCSDDEVVSLTYNVIVPSLVTANFSIQFQKALEITYSQTVDIQTSDLVVPYTWVIPVVLILVVIFLFILCIVLTKVFSKQSSKQVEPDIEEDRELRGESEDETNDQEVIE
jgi:hypothetical protein